MNAVRTIDQPVLRVLSAGRCDGTRFYLTAQQLDRKLYEATNKVLDALGGKWNRGAKAHVFGEDCQDLIDAAIETGSYTRPSDMGWFPTPRELAARIVAMADVTTGMCVLEPSAGEGSIAKEIVAAGANCDAVEVDGKRARVLDNLEICDNLRIGDFLAVSPTAIYDRVVMNPPFAKRADIAHVLHAREFLKPDGRLVAIMSGGIAFREDRLTQDLRAHCDSIDPLPDGSFSESGTDVRTVVVRMGARQ